MHLSSFWPFLAVTLISTNAHTIKHTHFRRDLTIIDPIPNPWKYVGCFTDTVSARGLNAAFNGADDMSQAKCLLFCSEKGYQYAGVEYSKECFCDNVMGSSMAPADPSTCNMGCGGASGQACGGPDRLTVFTTGTIAEIPKEKTDTSVWTARGCYSDKVSSRTLSDFQDHLPAEAMSVQGCLDTCEQKGFKYAGVEYSQECFCGNTIRNPGVPSDSSACNMPCRGKTSELCGGPDAINMYELVAVTLTSTTSTSTTSSTTTTTGTSTTSTSTIDQTTTTTTLSTTSSVSQTTTSTSYTTTTSQTTSVSVASTTTMTSSSTTTSTAAAQTTTAAFNTIKNWLYGDGYGQILITALTSPNIQACMDQCTSYSTEKCRALTYRASNSYCRLLREIGYFTSNGTASQNHESAAIPGICDSTPYFPNGQTTAQKFYIRCYFLLMPDSGGPLSTLSNVASHRDCMDKCGSYTDSDSRKCKAVTFNRKSLTCTLLSDARPGGQDFEDADSSWIAGAECAQENRCVNGKLHSVLCGAVPDGSSFSRTINIPSTGSSDDYLLCARQCSDDATCKAWFSIYSKPTHSYVCKLRGAPNFLSYASSSPQEVGGSIVGSC